MNRLFFILVFLTCSSSLSGMQAKTITKKDFSNTAKTYFLNAINNWLNHKDIAAEDNNLYKAFETIKNETIDNLLNDKDVINKIRLMHTHMQCDDRYHEAQELLTNNEEYKKKIMILGLQILITYAKIIPPNNIKKDFKDNSIVSNELSFLQVNHFWDISYLTALKAATLLLSLELSKPKK